jgi:hypothetical protein
MNATQFSIEQLAERLEKSVWTKGDIKRIYLNDEGYNTNKMSTKTYIYQREDGSFGVSCYIDCPSQPYSWIKSQQEEIVERVMRMVNREIASTVFVIECDNGYVDDNGDVVSIKDLSIKYHTYGNSEEPQSLIDKYWYKIPGVRVSEKSISELEAAQNEN